ncbi:hypothetical protein [Pararhizobium sp. O133]|uniref:hypothetical protein n=1 Tax=Pararhizobium sp. O133 TaxID=3449278 RepID=UPI003F6865F8
MTDLPPAISVDLNSNSAGRRAIAGFLFQILRSIRLGLQLSLAFSGEEENRQMMLRLEPEEGSDHQVTGGACDTIEQVKMRAVRRKWSSGEIAKEVLPDLLKTVRLGSNQKFVFVTNNITGLGPLHEYISTRSMKKDQKYRWGGKRLTKDEFEQRLAKAAGCGGVTAELRHLLDRFEVESIQIEYVEQEIDRALRPLLRPDDEPAKKRFELVGKLLTLATNGATLSAFDIKSLIDPDAHRLLAHIRSLPGMLATHVREDSVLLGYDPEKQARKPGAVSKSSFVILSGESGQGKTWSLADLALGQIQKGELAVVMRAPASLDEVERCINDRIWQPAHSAAASISVIAKSLRTAFSDGDGIWLTIYLDDIQERAFAQNLARCRWHEHGVRFVVSAQPRITKVVASINKSVKVTEVGNFHGGELRRFLTLHDRESVWEQLPDDIFELLLKPVHASVFVKLPQLAAWTGATEYELFSSYWQYACLESREQSDHPSDQDALLCLAGTLLNGNCHYPWKTAEVRKAGLDDPGLLRLEEAGLLRRPKAGLVQFAGDRMLNWAVAEVIAARIRDEGLTPAAAEALFANIEDLTTKNKLPVGARLGYVYFDALWLLSGSAEKTFLADLIYEHVSKNPQESRNESQWRDGFGSLGTRLLPALEELTRRVTSADRHFTLSKNIPFALAAIATPDPKPVEELAKRVLRSGNDESTEIALETACIVPLSSALDDIWEEHLKRALERSASVANEDSGGRFHLSQRYKLSSEAFRCAVHADPHWLEVKLGQTSKAIEIDQLLWALNDENTIDPELASKIWSRCRDSVIASSDVPSAAVIEMIGHFRDVELSPILNSVDGKDHLTASRVIRSLARSAPLDALLKISTGGTEYGWAATNWWFDELHATHAGQLAEAIRQNAQSSDDTLTELCLYYGGRPEAIDLGSLELVLDEFAERLRLTNQTRHRDDDSIGRLGHALTFISGLTEVWQFEALSRRAGSEMEKNLAQFACGRRGRRSMTRDSVGNECEKILAMIGGNCFHQLVEGELARTDVFGRQDGYISARWTSDSGISALLRQLDEEPKPESFDRVVRMEAFAVHSCDTGIERMIEAGTPVYLNAADIRSSDGRNLSGLRDRIAELLVRNDEKSVNRAAALTAFLSMPEDARPLVARFLSPNTSTELRQTILLSFDVLNYYEASLLPLACEMLQQNGRDTTHLVASYLAKHGDEDADREVIRWLQNQDLGTASTARRDYLNQLLKKPEGQEAVFQFLRRSRDNGHLVTDGNQLRLLSSFGDEWASRELANACYRIGYDRGKSITAIRHLQEYEGDEAYLAAKRMLVRNFAPDAIDLLLMIDLDRAASDLIFIYSDAKPSRRLEIERRLRIHLGSEFLAGRLETLANSSLKDRELAARLAGAVSFGVSLPWLETLSADKPVVQQAARDALRKRSREQEAMKHRDLISCSPKHLQWARMLTIFELVDPFYLWHRNDPANLKSLFDALPSEFFHEAKQLRQKRLKQVEDAAAKADKAVGGRR